MKDMMTDDVIDKIVDEVNNVSNRYVVYFIKKDSEFLKDIDLSHSDPIFPWINLRPIDMERRSLLEELLLLDYVQFPDSSKGSSALYVIKDPDNAWPTYGIVDELTENLIREFEVFNPAARAFAMVKAGNRQLSRMKAEIGDCVLVQHCWRVRDGEPLDKSVLLGHEDIVRSIQFKLHKD